MVNILKQKFQNNTGVGNKQNVINNLLKNEITNPEQKPMMAINKARLRQIHAWIAPIMFLPIILTLITGSLFQVAVLTGRGDEFSWLLDLHRGKFGSINLEVIYPFLNAFGVLMLASTGIIIWLQTRPRASRQYNR